MIRLNLTPIALAVKHTLLICSIGTMIMLPLTQAHASSFVGMKLDNKITSMSNTTSPKAYESNSRHVYSGGSMTIHNQIFNKDIVSITAPGIEAGCGGIDMFGGSFSFINGDQIVQLFRSIAQNAVGYLFQLALAVISPEISSLIRWFQDLVQKINGLASNSCRLAQGLVTGDINALVDKMNSKAGSANNNSGGGDASESFITAPIENLKKIYQNGTDGTYLSRLKNAFGWKESSSSPLVNESAKSDDPLYGNLLKQVLDQLSIDLTNDSSGVSGQKDQKEWIGEMMALFGTIVITNPTKSPTGDPSPSGSGTNATSGVTDLRFVPPIINFKDFIDGEGADGEPLQVYTCKDDKCDDISISSPRKDSSVLTKGYMTRKVRKMFCGGSGSDVDMQQCEGGIISALVNPVQSNLTDQQQNFMSQLPKQVSRYFNVLASESKAQGGGDGALKEFIKDGSVTIATELTKQLLLKMQDSMATTATGLNLDTDRKKEFNDHLNSVLKKFNDASEELLSKSNLTLEEMNKKAQAMATDLKRNSTPLLIDENGVGVNRQR